MITSTIPYRHVDDTQRTCEVQYDYTSDPYSILFLFGEPSGIVPWTVSRDLLISGLKSKEWVGKGDIVVRRSSSTRVRMSLRPNDSDYAVTISIPLTHLNNFLKLTTNYVKQGEEEHFIDWDEFETERKAWEKS